MMRSVPELMHAVGSVVLTTCCAITGCCALTGCSAEPARNAVLITLDTTRADALGAFGGAEGLTPHLDALAAEGIAFTRARTVAPLTLPSHASMLTGLYPPRHGVRDNNVAPLPVAAETLAERARDAGHETAGFVAAAVLGRAFGIDQGFETWTEPSDGEKDTSRYAERPAAAVLADVEAWLAKRDPGRPYFIWVHFFEPHNPYVPESTYLERAKGMPYLGEVAQVDAAVGRLIALLSGDPSWERTSVLVVADHGEGLGEHDEPTHAAYIWETTLRVPMILRLPGPSPPRAGERSDRVASVVDVAPTLAELLDLGDPFANADGRNLLAPAEPGRGVYFESFHGYLNYGWAPLAGWADSTAKVLHAPTPLVFAPDDTRETSALAGDPTAHVERARRGIDAVASASRLAVGDERVDEETMGVLQGLGYAAVGDAGGELPHPLEETERPDPHERSVEWIRLH